MQPVKISCVSYLNSKPFIEGLRKSEPEFEVSLDIPSECAAKLIHGTVDIGLVPVAILPTLKEYEIISSYCIGADGPVRTVVLASQVPLKDIKTILLDYQSITSVNLIKILAQHFWNISPLWENDTQYGYEDTIQGNTAGVIIGDRVFEHQHKFAYIYDLAEEWKNFTQKPFVFACWVTNKSLPNVVKTQFEGLLKSGMGILSDVIKKEATTYPNWNIEEYFRNNIQFDLTDEKKEGLQLFLSYLNNV